MCSSPLMASRCSARRAGSARTAGLYACWRQTFQILHRRRSSCSASADQRQGDMQPHFIAPPLPYAYGPPPVAPTPARYYSIDVECVATGTGKERARKELSVTEERSRRLGRSINAFLCLSKDFPIWRAQGLCSQTGSTVCAASAAPPLLLQELTLLASPLAYRPQCTRSGSDLTGRRA